MIATTDFNRSISLLFTNPVFKEIAQTGTSEYVLSKINKYSNELSGEKGIEIKTVIKKAYKHLRQNYRNEYLYKNTIANKILLGRHNLNTATLLNEFKVANSIADIIIINGTSTVYEIKTELDSPEKLQKQLNDYKKAFAKIFIVTHHTLINRYLKLIGDDAVGLITLTGKFGFSVIKDALIDFTQLDNEVMLKSLRKDEYSAIIQQFFGEVPCVSNIRFFKACLHLSKSIKPEIFHELMLSQLSKRKPAHSEWLESEGVPKELKHICLCLNPNQYQYQNLFSFLNRKL